MPTGDFFGKYRIIRRLATGGMAEVSLAQIVGAEGFHRDVVIKKILPQYSQDSSFIVMFKAEARLASKLTHPNIVQVFDFDCVGDQYYLAMEYVPGQDLSVLMRRSAEAGVSIGEKLSILIGLETLKALRCAHEISDESGPLNIVHRDVSPPNILVSYDGQVKLSDFGIAKAAVQFGAVTRTGCVKGKYPYMSPEQVEGRDLDARSDLFSLGLVLCELVTGRKPFAGKSEIQVIRQIAEGVIPKPRELSKSVTPELDRLIGKALERDPVMRHQSAREFYEDLADYGRGAGLLENEDLGRRMKELFPRELEIEMKRREAGGPAEASASLLQGVKTAVDLPSGTQKKKRGEIAAPPRGRRFRAVIFGVVAIAAVAAALLAVLSGGKPREMAVMLRMMEVQEQWFRQNILASFEKKENCRIRVLTYAQFQDVEPALKAAPAVDLVKVHLAAARGLAESGLLHPVEKIYADAGMQAELAALRADLLPAALSISEYPTMTGRYLYYVPRKIETMFVVYRTSKVKDAIAGWPAMRSRIDEALKKLNGYGLPAGYDLEEEPDKWDYYDILVLAYYWSRTEYGGKKVPRIVHRNYAYWGMVTDLCDRLAALSGSSDFRLCPSQALTDFYEWEAAFREIGLYNPKMWSGEDVLSGRAILEAMQRDDVFFTETHSLGVALLAGNAKAGVVPYLAQADDIGFTVMPQAVSFGLDGGGRPLREGGRRAEITGWLWGVPKTAQDPILSLKLARWITSRENHGREVEAFLLQPVRRDVMIGGGVLADKVREVVDKQMRLDEGLVMFKPRKAADVGLIQEGVYAAWRRIVVERGYSDGAGGISRQKIEELSKALLSGVCEAMK